jgi:glucokinase
MLLASDVGGTKTLVGLFAPAEPRPTQIVLRAYPTAEFTSFTAILDAFDAHTSGLRTVDAVAVGVAGPVVNHRAQLTNVPWVISADEIAARCATPRVRLLNDLETMAQGVPVLQEAELAVLQTGRAHPDGNAVLIAAGTGLGQAYLHRIDGRLRPAASEGGHADFAARTAREIELLQLLRRKFGRAEVEQVLSGPGLLNVSELTHQRSACVVTPTPVTPEAISESAIDGRCGACVEALDVFVSAYGAETGNLALRGMATSGVFIGGGIAPKILPALQRGGFLAAFLDKAPLTDLLSRMPVRIIMNENAALIGAAVAAQHTLAP